MRKFSLYTTNRSSRKVLGCPSEVGVVMAALAFRSLSHWERAEARGLQAHGHMLPPSL
jgi:hypothetical protein